MTSPVSALEAIARTVALDVYHNAVDSDDGSHSMDMPVAVALITDAMCPLARQAESLQRENAELREALRPFAEHIDKMKFDLDNNGNPVPDDQSVGWVYVTCGNFRRARALLGGSENAE